MAFNNNDFLLQSILEEQAKANTHLSALSDVLLSMSKKSGGKSGKGAGGKNNNPPKSSKGSGNKQYSSVLKDMMGEVSHLSRSFSSGSGVATQISSLGVSAKALSSSFGMIPGPIGLAATSFLKIVEVGAQLHEYMNEQLQMYNQLSSAGITLANGMISAKKAAASSLLSNNDFNAAIIKNSDAVAAMTGEYGDGVAKFGDMLGAIQRTTDASNLFGVSQSQLADLTAKSYKFNKIYAGQASLRAVTEQQSSVNFINQMTELSKSVGKSVDSLVAKFGDMTTNLDSFVTQNALTQNFGLAQDKAAEVVKGFNSFFTSLGPTGDVLQQLNASKLALYQLPEEYNFGSIIHEYTDFLRSMELDGVTDAAEIKKRSDKWITSNQNRISSEAAAAYEAGRTQVGTFLNQLQVATKLSNEQAKKIPSAMEKLTNQMNVWWGTSISEPLSKWWASTQEGLANWALNATQEGTGFWQTLNGSVKYIFSDSITYLDNLLAGFSGWLEGLGADLFGPAYMEVSKAFENFMNNLLTLPTKLWDSVMGWWNGSSKEHETETKSTINSVHDSVNSTFKDMGDWWTAAKDWFSSDETKAQQVVVNESSKAKQPVTLTQPTKSGTAQVTAQPEFTKPSSLEDKEPASDKEFIPDPASLQASQTNEALLRAISQLLNSVDTQNAANSQNSILLRTIAENTDGTRNT